MKVSDLYKTSDDFCLGRLRHAVWGDWFHSFKIKTFPKLHAVFKLNSHNDASCKTTLESCTCDDCTDDGKPIRPCVHMYRLAIETGNIRKLIGGEEIEQNIRSMRGPLYNNFYQGIICRGYYNEAHKWGLSAVTFNELSDMGLIQGDKQSYRLTEKFFKNAAAWVYYTMIDPRRK